MGRIPESEYIEPHGYMVATAQLIEFHHTPAEVETFNAWFYSQTGIVLQHQRAFGIDVRMIFGGKPERPLSGMYFHVHENQYDAMMRAAG